jgi:hypothetical protein
MKTAATALLFRNLFEERKTGGMLREFMLVVQFDCHPEQAVLAQRGIWASRAKLRRFAGVNDVGARSRNPERSEGPSRAFGSPPYLWRTGVPPVS